jgi:hypothetical protein
LFIFLRKATWERAASCFVRTSIEQVKRSVTNRHPMIVKLQVNGITRNITSWHVEIFALAGFSTSKLYDNIIQHHGQQNKFLTRYSRWNIDTRQSEVASRYSAIASSCYWL